jgi:geranylgeranylglycerol-phosphate geranylgeranyltransferase
MTNDRRASSIEQQASEMRTLLALFLIIRPLNVAIAGLSILLAAALVQPFSFTWPVACAIISGMLIAAGANVINDLCDVDIDRINRPRRALPSRQLTPEAARTFMIFLFVCGNFFSIFINWAAAMMAVGASILLIVYSLRLKRQPLAGNLAVSAATAMAFIYGALAAQNGLSVRPAMSRLDGLVAVSSMARLRSWNWDWRAGIFPAVFSFLFHFGREVIKDIEDQIGDRAVQARTLPLAYGLTTAQWAATGALALLMAITPLPFCLGIYSAAYFWTVLLGVDAVLLLAIYRLWKHPEPNCMRQVSAILKADMLVGLAAIYWGR